MTKADNEKPRKEKTNMKKRINKIELLELLDSLQIDHEEFWILSSSALVLRDLFPDAGDLDLAVTEEGLRQLKENYDVILKPDGMYQVLENVECFLDEKEDWKIEKWQDYYLESIHKYYDYLKSSTREKDKARIPLVEEYIKTKH